MKQLPAICAFLFCGFSLIAQTDKVEEIKQKLEGAQSASKRVELLLRLASTYDSKDWEQSVIYARQALDLAKKTAHDSLLFESYFRLSSSYRGLGHYDSALVLGKKALTTAFNDRARADAYHHLGDIYELLSEYEKSLNAFLQAIEIKKSMNDDQSLANTLNLVAFVYKGMSQYEKAIDVLNEAGDIYEKMQDATGKARVTFNIGLMMMEMDKHAESIPYFRKAVQVGKITEENNPYVYSLFCNNMTNAFAHMLEEDVLYYDSAVFYGKKNLRLKQALKDNRGIANAHNNLAGAYDKSHEYDGSYFHAGEALKLSDSLGFKTIKRNALRYLINAATGLAGQRELNNYFSDYIEVVEDLSKAAQSEMLNNMAAKYETEKKEQQIAMHQAALTQQTNQRNMLIAGIVLMLLIVGLVYRSERLKTRKNKQIEALLKEIHHRVKNNLQVISSLLNMQSRNVEDEGMLGAIREGQNRVKAMSLIHQKLYQNDNITEIDFQEYASELSKQLAAVFNQSQQKIQSEVKGDVRLDIDTAIPLGLILNELISNAYKYAFDGKEEGTIQIMLDRIDKGELELKVKDDGKGIPADFDLKKVKSLGLKLVNILTKQLKGSWEYSNNNGTEFLIRFKEVAVV